MPRQSQQHLRVGDDERAAAVELLDVHAKAGRLGEAEHRQRCEWALMAGTRLDIEAIFDDLPAPHPVFSVDAPPPALLETRLSNTMAVLTGGLVLLGAPAGIVVGVVSGAWWILAAVLGAAVVAFVVTASAMKDSPDG